MTILRCLRKPEWTHVVYHSPPPLSCGSSAAYFGSGDSPGISTPLLRQCKMCCLDVWNNTNSILQNLDTCLHGPLLLSHQPVPHVILLQIPLIENFWCSSHPDHCLQNLPPPALLHIPTGSSLSITSSHLQQVAVLFYGNSSWLKTKTYMQIIWVLGPECFNITAIYKLEPKYKSPTSRNNQHIICINDSSHVSNSETGTTRIREHWFCLGYGLPIWIYENWSIFRKDFPQITRTSWICFEKSSRHVNEWIFIYFTEILTLHKIRPGKSDYRVAKDTPPPLLSLSARICSIMSACATFIVTLANICAASQEDNNQRFHLCD